MSLVPVMLHEALRRQQREADIRAAVLRYFELAPPRFCVRRTMVYGRVAQMLGETTLNNALAAKTVGVVVALGARPIKKQNRRLFVGLRPAGMPEEEATRLSKECRRDTQAWAARWRRFTLRADAPYTRVSRVSHVSPAQRRALEAQWRKRLEESGFDDIEGPAGTLRHAPDYATERDRARPSINRGYLDMATAYYYELQQELQVWELHAFEGATVRAIASKLEVGRDRVQTIITRLRGHMAKRGFIEETSNGEGQEVDERRSNRTGPPGDRD